MHCPNVFSWLYFYPGCLFLMDVTVANWYLVNNLSIFHLEMSANETLFPFRSECFPWDALLSPWQDRGPGGLILFTPLVARLLAGAGVISCLL